MEQNSKRLIGADLLRILATLCVIFIHICSKYRKLDVYDDAWLVGIVYDHLSRWCVPAFLAISGMTFLDPEKEITTRTLFHKYVWRIVTMFFFWSVLYIVIDPNTIAQFIKGGGALDKPITFTFSKLLVGHYHLGYLLYLLACYLCVPFFRLFTSPHGSKRLIEGYLLIWFVFTLLPPVSTQLFHSELTNAIRSSMDMIGLASFVPTFLGYFLLGYYLKKYPLSGWKEFALYGAGILSATLILYFNITVSRSRGSDFNALFGYRTATNAIFVAAIFHFFIHRLSNFPLFQNEDRRKALIAFSRLTAGVYLCHPYFITILRAFPTNVETMVDPKIGVLLLAVTVYALSLIVTFILSKIPVINKYCM